MRLSGEFDLAACDDLRAFIADVIESGSSNRIILDLAGVTFIDCATVAVLLNGYTAARQRRGDYRLTNARGAVHRVLDVLGLIDLLHPESTV